jgi:hypothetical protein
MLPVVLMARRLLDTQCRGLCWARWAPAQVTFAIGGGNQPMLLTLAAFAHGSRIELC